MDDTKTADAASELQQAIESMRAENAAPAPDAPVPPYTNGHDTAPLVLPTANGHDAAPAMRLKRPDFQHKSPANASDDDVMRLTAEYLAEGNKLNIITADELRAKVINLTPAIEAAGADAEWARERTYYLLDVAYAMDQSLLEGIVLDDISRSEMREARQEARQVARELEVYLLEMPREKASDLAILDDVSAVLAQNLSAGATVADEPADAAASAAALDAPVTVENSRGELPAFLSEKREPGAAVRETMKKAKPVMSRTPRVEIPADLMPRMDQHFENKPMPESLRRFLAREEIATPTEQPAKKRAKNARKALAPNLLDARYDANADGLMNTTAILPESTNNPAFVMAAPVLGEGDADIATVKKAGKVALALETGRTGVEIAAKAVGKAAAAATIDKINKGLEARGLHAANLSNLKGYRLDAYQIMADRLKQDKVRNAYQIALYRTNTETDDAARNEVNTALNRAISGAFKPRANIAMIKDVNALCHALAFIEKNSDTDNEKLKTRVNNAMDLRDRIYLKLVKKGRAMLAVETAPGAEVENARDLKTATQLERDHLDRIFVKLLPVHSDRAPRLVTALADRLSQPDMAETRFAVLDAYDRGGKMTKQRRAVRKATEMLVSSAAVFNGDKDMTAREIETERLALVKAAKGYERAPASLLDNIGYGIEDLGTELDRLSGDILGAPIAPAPKATTEENISAPAKVKKPFTPLIPAASAAIGNYLDGRSAKKGEETQDRFAAQADYLARQNEMTGDDKLAYNSLYTTFENARVPASILKLVGADYDKLASDPIETENYKAFLRAMREAYGRTEQSKEGRKIAADMRKFANAVKGDPMSDKASAAYASILATGNALLAKDTAPVEAAAQNAAQTKATLQDTLQGKLGNAITALIAARDAISVNLANHPNVREALEEIDFLPNKRDAYEDYLKTPEATAAKNPMAYRKYLEGSLDALKQQTEAGAQALNHALGVLRSVPGKKNASAIESLQKVMDKQIGVLDAVDELQGAHNTHLDAHLDANVANQLNSGDDKQKIETAFSAYSVHDRPTAKERAYDAYLKLLANADDPETLNGQVMHNITHEGQHEPLKRFIRALENQIHHEINGHPKRAEGARKKSQALLLGLPAAIAADEAKEERRLAAKQVKTMPVGDRMEPHFDANGNVMLINKALPGNNAIKKALADRYGSNEPKVGQKINPVIVTSIGRFGKWAAEGLARFAKTTADVVTHTVSWGVRLAPAILVGAGLGYGMRGALILGSAVVLPVAPWLSIAGFAAAMAAGAAYGGFKGQYVANVKDAIANGEKPVAAALRNIMGSALDGMGKAFNPMTYIRAANIMGESYDQLLRDRKARRKEMTGLRKAWNTVLNVAGTVTLIKPVFVTPVQVYNRMLKADPVTTRVATGALLAMVGVGLGGADWHGAGGKAPIIQGPNTPQSPVLTTPETPVTPVSPHDTPATLVTPHDTPVTPHDNTTVVALPADVRDFAQGDAMQAIIKYWEQKMAIKGAVPTHLHMADGSVVNMHARIGAILKHVKSGKATLTELTTLMDDAAEGGHVSKAFGDAASLKPLAQLALPAKLELIERFTGSTDKGILWNVRHAQKFLADLQERAIGPAPVPHARPTSI